MTMHLATSTFVLLLAVAAARLLPLMARTRHALLIVGLAKFAIPDAAVLTVLRLAGLDLARLGRDVVPSALRVFGRDAASTPPPATTSVDWLLVLWGGVATIVLIRWAVLRSRTVAAVANGSTSASTREHELLIEAMRAVKVRTAVALVRSRMIGAPAVIGVIRPTIALPLNGLDDLTADEARAVLLHECAHVARRDNLWGMFEAVFAAALWFHPLVHYALRQIAAAREEACDEVAADGARPETYLAALTKICRASIAPRTAGAACMASPHIKRRLEHLMNYERLKRIALPHRAALLATAVVVLLMTPLTTTFATEQTSGDRYGLTVQVEGSAARFTVDCTVVDRETGEVVSAPRLETPARVPIAASSRHGALEFKIKLLLNPAGSGTATLDVIDGSASLQHTTIVIVPKEQTAPAVPSAPISLNLKDADLADVLKIFAQLTNRRVMIGPGVNGTVTVALTDTPWDQALDIIARQNNLEITVDADKILVTKKP